ncbi:DUF4174 domain-containing protein [Phytohalomonas tamaricis]|uniref:DUF4174 domain-containing protein n=1 Tax=Phytohalomonas tamaricis TaxID=2081032 RepID=UPI0021D45540|nr:DUF4174 domain-containing protein [Phytohalomonas tamaricis]
MKPSVQRMVACALITITSAASAADPANPLVSDAWHSRPLIVVSPSEADSDYQRMRGILADSTAEMNERDMVLYTVVNGHGKRDGNAMTEYETHALLSDLNLDAQGPLSVILIGKDGGKKIELKGFVAPQQIFDTIDRMPMRQSNTP